jgi:hypothetical protein
MMPPTELGAHGSSKSPEQSSMLMAKDIADEFALASALRRFGKRFCEGRGGLGRNTT